MTRFSEALEILLETEGGYVNDPDDPGGETNHGITVAVARQNGYHGPMRSIPMSIVEHIYKKKYWDVCKCDDLPSTIRFEVFDTAVNQGPVMAAKFLQRALRINDDGVIGQRTIMTARQMKPEFLDVRFYVERMKHYLALGNFKHYGRGWTRRALESLERSFL